jgi:hypothetical protein
MSPERRHNLTHRLLPLAVVVAAAGGVATYGFSSGNSHETCGTATAESGQDPITVVHFAALNAEGAKPTGHHYGWETAAGDSVSQQWSAAHPGEPFQPGAKVEVHVSGGDINNARLLPEGDPGCGIPASPAASAAN